MAAKAQSRSGRRRLSGKERREKIAVAAGEVFAERGYHAASIAEIASRSGVSKAVLYDHFESKQALHEYLLDSQIADLLAHANDAVAGDGEPQERMRRGIASFITFMRERPSARRLLFNGDGAAPEVARTFQRIQRQATEGLVAMIAADPDFLAGDPERLERIEILAQIVRGGLNELAAWALEHPDAELEKIVDVALMLYWPGVRSMLAERLA